MIDSTGADIAQVGRKRCGCVVAVDLDCQSEQQYLNRGYVVEYMETPRAKELLRASGCTHGKKQKIGGAE